MRPIPAGVTMRVIWIDEGSLSVRGKLMALVAGG